MVYIANYNNKKTREFNTPKKAKSWLIKKLKDKKKTGEKIRKHKIGVVDFYNYFLLTDKNGDEKRMGRIYETNHS